MAISTRIGLYGGVGQEYPDRGVVVSATANSQALALTQASAIGRGTAVANPSAIGLTVFIRSTGVLTLGIPELYTPSDGGIARDAAPLLSWSTITGATTYDVEVSDDPTFAAGVARFTVSSAEAQRGYEFGKTFYWRVRANGLGAVSQFSPAQSFVVPDFSPAPDLTHDTAGRARMLEQFKEYA